MKEQALKEVRGQIMLYEYAQAVKLAYEWAQKLYTEIPERLQVLASKKPEDITKEDAQQAESLLVLVTSLSKE